MTIASVTTDINIGPFKIPSNGQNMILNNYAQRKNLSIEVVIPEPILSDALATTQWLHKQFKFKQIILCSIHQLPQEPIKLKQLIETMHHVEFHFCLEGISGEGESYIFSCAEEARIFRQATTIDADKYGWSALFAELKKAD